MFVVLSSFFDPSDYSQYRVAILTGRNFSQFNTSRRPADLRIWFSRVSKPDGRLAAIFHGGVSCASIAITKTSPAFETTRKRRKSFPSESRVKRGRRFVHGDIELIEKLGRDDLCPCGSGRRFQDLLYAVWLV